jgi:HEAT repeat protein
MTHTNHFADFLAAIDRSDDPLAERNALALTPDDEPALIALLATPDADMRWWAVRALAACGAQAAPAAVAGQLNDDDSAVRAATLLALAHLHQRHPTAVAPLLDQAAVALKDDDGLVRQTASDALAMCGDDAVPALARILFQQSHEGARTRAAAALRKVATMKAAGVLYALLNDHNHMVRMYAYEGLDEMGLLETVLVTLS